MKRTTTPDEYTEVIKWLRVRRAAGKVSWFTFAAIISHIWDMRHARA